MTIAVDLGRKATKQTNKQIKNVKNKTVKNLKLENVLLIHSTSTRENLSYGLAIQPG